MKDGGLRLFVVGYESGNEQILKNIKKGVVVERARRFTEGLPRPRHPDPRHVHRRAAGRDARHDRGDDPLREGDAARDAAGARSRHRIRAPRCTTGCASTSYLTVDSLVDETGYQKCTVSLSRRCRPTRSSRAVETCLSRATTSARATSGSRSRRWRATAKEGARMLGEGKAVPRARCEAPPDRADAGDAPTALRAGADVALVPARARVLGRRERRTSSSSSSRRGVLPPAPGARRARQGLPPAGHDAEAAQGPRDRPLREPRELLPSGLSRVPDRLRRRATPSDPAVEIVERIQRDFPDRDIVLSVGDAAGRQPQGREPAAT